jgi:hypothetical protein
MTGFVVEHFSTGRMVADRKALSRPVVTERASPTASPRGGHAGA